MYSSDGLMPQDGPQTVLKSLVLVDQKIAGAKIDMDGTYDNSFVQAVK
jgi:NitT/TauT family transport system substrate-binding protein